MQDTMQNNTPAHQPDDHTVSHAGATVVITHQVNPDKQAEYEQWLTEIGPLCKSSTGLLDYHIIRPVNGLTSTYSIMIRYDSELHLKQWMDSTERKRLISKIESILTGSDAYQIQSGLDFWFMPAGAKAKIPVKWKQFLITWSAIYPLVLGVPLLVMPLLKSLTVPENHYLDALFITALIVFLMVYVVMPRYTKLVKDWLFR